MRLAEYDHFMIIANQKRLLSTGVDVFYGMCLTLKSQQL